MAQSPSPTRILIIDDDEMSRELFVVLLETKGYAVTSAESGEAALTLIESIPRPDIVLTDMQMPGSTPAQLAGRLRRACGRGTLLLAISGSQPAPDILARYDGFLLKPFTTSDLASFIQSASIAKKPTPQELPEALSLAASAEESASKPVMNAAPHSSAPPDAAPILDETIYGQLARSMPAPQLREMYAMCLSDARTRIASMRDLISQHDSAQFMRQAHTIKGSCGMLGAVELHRMAATLEKHGPGTDATAVNSLDELSAACDRLERMLGSRA